MKRYILHIIALVITCFLVTVAKAQTSLDPKKWSGGTLSTGTYILTGNTDVTNTININSGNTVILDLNGYVLAGSNVTTVINVNGGKLTIKDSNPTLGHAGKLNDMGVFIWTTSNYTMSVRGGIILNRYNNATTDRKAITISGGTCIVEYAKIMGCYTTGIGAAVTISSSGTFIMNGGEISYNYAKGYDSKLSGIIYGEPSNNNNGSYIEISNTLIADNKTEGDGGAICAYRVELINSQFERNQAAGNGGALYIRNNGNGGYLNVDNCSFDSNSAMYGGAIYVNNNLPCEIKNDTKIINNVAQKQGGGIYSTGTMNITNNTSIENNTAEDRGGGIYSTGTMNISNGVIKYNSATYGGGLYLVGPTKIIGSRIDINYSKISGGGIHSSANTTITNSFITGNRTMETETGDGVVNHGRGGGFNFVGTDVEEESDAVTFILDNTLISGNAAMYYGGGGQMQGEAKVIMRNNTKINENTSILKGAAGLHVTGGGFFYMKETCEISKNVALGGVGGAIHSSYECHLHLDGGTISNNVVYGRGGGVHVNTGGDLILTNIEISGNKAFDGYNLIACTIEKRSDKQYYWSKPINDGTESPGYGGGVLVNSGSCTMNESSLSENYAQTTGGGIALMMNESGNYAHHVRLANFTLNSGSVNNNKCDGNGAGIYLKENILTYLTDDEKNKYIQLVQGGDWIPKIILNGGSISNNSAKLNGGGAYQEQNTQFIVNNNKTINIENNSANQSGGAVYIHKGSFTVNGNAIIKSNKAIDNDGGAIYLGQGTTENPSEFIVGANGILTLGGENKSEGNSSGRYGGALFCAGTFTVNGTLNLQNNTAVNGGGVCVENGAVTLAADKNSVISNNIASEFGGGLYVSGSQPASFKGGLFLKNKAKAGGGVFASGAITLSLASDVKENEAVIGGGIYLEGGVDMEFGNGLIVANSAISEEQTNATAYLMNKDSQKLYGAGGGIFIADGSKLWFSSSDELGIYNNNATHAGADICANGNNTMIVLPNPKLMDLKNFDTIGNELYWVEDYMTGDSEYDRGLKIGTSGIRYVDALLDTELPISRMIYDNNQNVVDITQYACLDLGYDLVFVNLQVINLDKEEYAAIRISYKDGDTNDKIAYQNVLFYGKDKNTPVTLVIGLPSGDWNFKATDWMTVKYEEPTSNPTHLLNGSDNKEGFINIKREGLNGSTDKETTITLNFTELEETLVIEAHKRFVNYMKLND